MSEQQNMNNVNMDNNINNNMDNNMDTELISQVLTEMDMKTKKRSNSYNGTK